MLLILNVVLTLNYNDDCCSTSTYTCKLINLLSYLHVYFTMYWRLLCLIFLRESSFLNICEQFDEVTCETSIAEDQEEETQIYYETKKMAKKSKMKKIIWPEHQIKLNLLTALSEHLPEIQPTGSTRVIPCMQISYLLTGRKIHEFVHFML